MKIVGILNVTPDSFYDGNKSFSLSDAVYRAKKLIEEGADIIDIGGESSRPGSNRISLEEEKRRVFPVIEEIRKFSDILLSVDTYKSEVLEGAIKRGANFLNDISALRFDEEKMLRILKKYRGIKIVLMHMKGEPKTMQENPYYDDVVKELKDFFVERTKFLKINGIEEERIIIDPGIGFGKRLKDNLEIIKNINEFKKLGFPVYVGHSRKSFIGMLLNEKNPEKRLSGTLAVSLYLYKKKVDYLRVHDIKETKDIIKMWRVLEDDRVLSRIN